MRARLERFPWGFRTLVGCPSPTRIGVDGRVRPTGPSMRAIRIYGAQILDPGTVRSVINEASRTADRKDGNREPHAAWLVDLMLDALAAHPVAVELEGQRAGNLVGREVQAFQVDAIPELDGALVIWRYPRARRIYTSSAIRSLLGDPDEDYRRIAGSIGVLHLTPTAPLFRLSGVTIRVTPGAEPVNVLVPLEVL